METRATQSRWIRWVPFILVAAIGLAIRLPQLAARPMHTDEAVNAYIVGQLLGGEPFTYDPQDRHGPALAALALPLARIQGARSFSDLTESELRLTAVVAGTITILLFGAAAEMFGFVPSILAALLSAIAPLPVYYDRYFIHESLFCAATFGLILSGWHAFRTNSIGSAMLAGACAALMLACKETAIIHFFALVAAGLVFWLWNLHAKSLARSARVGPLLAGAAAFLALLAILFTWFGRNASGLSALVRVIPDTLARAAGQGHEKPFWYFGKLLAGGWSGGLLLTLACLGLFVALRKRDDSAWPFLAYYGLLIAAIYSLIPYKTPWLALSLWLPLALFAAKTIESIYFSATKRLHWYATVTAFGILAFATALMIAHDTRQRVFLGPADESNPYAYAHTSDDILGLPTEIAEMARRNGISEPRISVIASDPWPLPWYLRHFKQVGFWQPGQQVADADFYVTTTDAANQYADRLRGFRPDFFGSRPGVLILLWLPEPK
jgi:uncharacterized protein (TIGR03663 family)